jgi:hypothetical protein
VQTNTTLWNKHKYQGLGLVLDVAAGSDNRKCGLHTLIHIPRARKVKKAEPVTSLAFLVGEALIVSLIDRDVSVEETAVPSRV